MIATILIAGLFGHRHVAEPLPVQWWYTVTSWIGAHWAVLAVVIPVAGAIGAGIVNHYLALARENRSRRLTRGDLRGRVNTELAARLLVHCRELGSAIGNPEPDFSAWRQGNDALRSRCESPDVVEALGRKYVNFVAAVDEEHRTLNVLARQSPKPTSQERFRWTVRVAESAHRAIASYLPFVRDFGEVEQARRLQRESGEALKSTKLRHA